VDPKICYFADQAFPQGLPRYFIDTILQNSNFALKKIPLNYKESDCVCIGEI